jgi:aerobic carbon-monoxide dehydrogenase large subunit
MNAPKTNRAVNGHAPKAFRVEDDRLLRGLGRFADDDVDLPGRLFGYFIRSPHAFARIVAVDAKEARAVPGVIAVLTAADMKAAGAGTVVRHFPMTGRGGTKLIDPVRPALADDRVMHIGQAVVLVVATTNALAQDAAERVAISYEELAPIVEASKAIEPNAPLLWPEAPNNTAIEWQSPVSQNDANEREVDRIIATAPHVARITELNQRIFAASMEPRGATASFDAASGSYRLRSCSQSAFVLRAGMAAAMGVPPEKIRVITEDVGGGFGMKTPPYPEYVALLVAAKMTGRPVHWMATRAESFLSDNQARDMLGEGALALDDNGQFIALRMRCLVNLGAFVGSVGVHLATNNFARCLPCMYHIPTIDLRVRCVFTNTIPTAPYRGAGRPEANYLLERLVEEAARITGIASDQIRKRNLIPRSAIPYKTPIGAIYDSGDFPVVFDKAIELSQFADFERRKSQSRENGKLRGIGISCFLEHSGGVPTEGAGLTFPGDGKLAVDLGAQSTGQGHASVFPRLVADQLGVPVAQIFLRQGDTNLGVMSSATVASRSAMTVSNAITRASQVLLDKGKKIAGDLMEAAVTDIVYDGGVFTVTGTDRRITLFELADRARELKARGAIPEDLDTRLTADAPQTFPNGCHVAEIEIDPETGGITVVDYTAVDDCGNVLDHMIVEGQLHGGLAQGIGQALLEQTVYDSDSGQLVSGSFMDYAMPRADDMPRLTSVEQSVPATTNPLGVKGVGEAGTTGSLAAVMNAIADAIPGGVGARLDMPATPAKIWAACQAAKL